MTEAWPSGSVLGAPAAEAGNFLSAPRGAARLSGRRAAPLRGETVPCEPGRDVANPAGQRRVDLEQVPGVRQDRLGDVAAAVGLVVREIRARRGWRRGRVV